MDANLVLVRKKGTNKSFPLLSVSDVTVVGRRRDCDLRIPLVTVSKKHCQFYSENNQIKIRDLNSKNGTLLNGKRIDEAVIQPGDLIKIGPLTFISQINGIPQEPSKADFSAKAARSKDIQAQEPADEIVQDDSSQEDIFDDLDLTGPSDLETPDNPDDLMDFLDKPVE